MRKILTAIVRALLLGSSGALSLWSQQPAAPRAARELARGTVLALADIAVDATTVVATGATGAAATTVGPTIVGWEVRRLVRAGEVLRAPAITPPTLVFAGTTVQVVADVDGVKVSRPGTAMGAGAIGERVRIRLDQQRTIIAIVAGPATVRPS